MIRVFQSFLLVLFLLVIMQAKIYATFPATIKDCASECRRSSAKTLLGSNIIALEGLQGSLTILKETPGVI